MRIKTGAYKYHFRFELFKARNPVGFNQIPHRHPLGVGGHWQVQHVGCGVLGTGVRVKRVLKKPNHQHPLIAFKDVFSTVSVMHVKVNHRHAFEAMALQRITRSNGNVVEKAKTHGLVVAGMMTGWPHSAKGVFNLSGHDAVSRRKHRTRRSQCGLPGMHIHQGVRVDLRVLGPASVDVVQ